MPRERERDNVHLFEFICSMLLKHSLFKSVIPIVSGDEAPLPLKAGVKPTFTERPTIRQTDEVAIL
jgi:hypothetical protein